MSQAKVELGRFLFYDVRLSGNETQACASCHRQELAFTDGSAVSIGSTGEATPRSSMSLANVAYSATLTWANPTLRRLSEQALVPMFGEEPVELGLAGLEEELLARLREVPEYQALFPDAFPRDEDPFTVSNVTKAIASFERTLISADSPYDRYIQGDANEMSESAQRGMGLFFGEKFDCFHCHGGFNFSVAVDHEGLAFDQAAFHNTGLYNIDGMGSYPPGNRGLYEVTGDPLDMGKFRAPTLRNIAVTQPYMHDGSIETLEEVMVNHYSAGGRVVTEGEYAGDGRENPLKSPFIREVAMTDEELHDMLAFLESLTDSGFLTDPRFASPWE